MKMSERSIRIFQGRDTGQLLPNGRAPDHDSWFWEPADYEGDVVFDGPYGTREEARTAGLAYFEHGRQ